jgi:uncharacterized protein (DUF885 family)
LVKSTQPQTDREHASLDAALSIIDDAWEELRRTSDVQLQMGAVPARLPDLSIHDAQRRSSAGRDLLGRVAALELGALPHNIELTLRLVRFRATAWCREADWYWKVVDPLGIGFYGLFLLAPYCGGFLLNTIHGQLASFPFDGPGDLDRYLGLITDYARLIEQFTERTKGQAERGIRMPRVQVQQARALLARFKSGMRQTLGVAPQRLATLDAGMFLRELEVRVVTLVEPAFDRAIDLLSDTYLARAPETVGLAQYPGGAELYCDLVKLHTTLELTPEQVHARGRERMAEIQSSMETIRAELGFRGDGASFLAHLDGDIRWRSNTVEGVTAAFQVYIDRLKPHLNDCFSFLPQAQYGVTPLPSALQGSMTYGYYDAPRRDRAEGIYLFNGNNLTQQPLFALGSLTYHELMPGHHLHYAIQLEDQVLPPFRRYSFVNAYNEGWAEYAATLAGEIGMYEEPEERYGRLAWDAFFTCRLVVDTGMNVLGWSLEQAREYMRLHGGMTETDVRTESIRYSCDIPGQGLAYKLGDTQILRLRERMRLAHGARFDLKTFHAAVVGHGSLPMPELEWHLDHEIERLRALR